MGTPALLVHAPATSNTSKRSYPQIGSITSLCIKVSIGSFPFGMKEFSSSRTLAGPQPPSRCYGHTAQDCRIEAFELKGPLEAIQSNCPTVDRNRHLQQDRELRAPSGLTLTVCRDAASTACPHNPPQRVERKTVTLSNSWKRAFLAGAAPSVSSRLPKQRHGSTARAIALSESAAPNVTAERQQRSAAPPRPFRSPVAVPPGPTPRAAKIRQEPRRADTPPVAAAGGAAAHLPAGRPGPLRAAAGGREERRRGRAAGPGRCRCVGACRTRGRGGSTRLYSCVYSFIYFKPGSWAKEP